METEPKRGEWHMYSADTVKQCEVCKGSGKVCIVCHLPKVDHGLFDFDAVKCDKCNGTGYVPLQRD
jgi:DnaJ-class molecular chaperone